MYYAIAVDHTDTIEGEDPDVLDRLSRFATSFTLGAGDHRTLALKLFVLQ